MNVAATPVSEKVVTVTVNGTTYEHEVPARRLLVHFLRDDLGLTGTHIGCDTGSCGACTVHLDGVAVKSCAVLAVQADGGAVTTVEGLGDEELTPLQQSFSDHHALQCGYCTPGMLMSATALLAENPSPTEEEVKVGLQGNICRCTGYWNIVEAVVAAGKGSSVTAVETEGTTTLQKGAVGQSIPRKEDRRLVQGQGVFFDDVKRHGMGYVHFVRSPYAHARIQVDRRQRGARAAGRLRHADRRRGRDPHRPLLPDRGGAGRKREGLRARGRQGALRRRAGRRGGRGDARARARRVGARRGRLRPARRRRRRTRSARRRRPRAPRGVRRERLVQRCLGVGRRRRCVRRGRPRREDLRAPLRPLQLDAARARRRARRVQPRHRASGRSRRTTSSRASP